MEANHASNVDINPDLRKGYELRVDYNEELGFCR